MKDGEQYQDAPHLKFQVHGIKAKSKLFQKGRANAISMAIPVNEIAADHAMLTALGQPLVAQLGGIDRLKQGWPSAISVMETPHAVIIQAGESPQWGDVNQPDTLALYREVYKKIGSLIGVAGKRSMSFNLNEDYVERTEQWFMRLRDA